MLKHFKSKCGERKSHPFLQYKAFCLSQVNCNLMCGPEYGPETKRSMAQMSEKETPFELIEALLKYIETLQVAGAVLVFLPGWNLIYSMQKHLEMNAHFGQLDSVFHSYSQ